MIATVLIKMKSFKVNVAPMSGATTHSMKTHCIMTWWLHNNDTERWVLLCCFAFHIAMLHVIMLRLVKLSILVPQIPLYTIKELKTLKLECLFITSFGRGNSVSFSLFYFESICFVSFLLPTRSFFSTPVWLLNKSQSDFFWFQNDFFYFNFLRLRSDAEC